MSAWLVFSRSPKAEAFGLVRSRKGVWWKLVPDEYEALALVRKLGKKCWIKQDEPKEQLDPLTKAKRRLAQAGRDVAFQEYLRDFSEKNKPPLAKAVLPEPRTPLSKKRMARSAEEARQLGMLKRFGRI